MSTPVFDSGVGNGASYAATTSSGSSVVHVMRMSCPGWKSVPVRRTRSRKRSHVSEGGRPEKMPVFSTTSREIRSGRSTARRMPSGPPQSCITTVTSRRSSSSTKRSSDAVCASYEYQSRSTGLSLRPKPR